jgi:lysophospholipase L1-like esterase
VAPLSHVAVSMYFKDRAAIQSYHYEAQQTAYVSSDGDFTGKESMPVEQKFTSHYFLSGIMVEGAAGARVVVAFGDSITDGFRSTIDGDRRFPDDLAERLQKTPGFEHVAVVNQGIGGNRVLHDGRGAKALARFDRDVLSVPNVSHVIFLEGINDIGWPDSPIASADEAVTAEQLFDAYRQLVERAHLRGIKVIGATLMPFEDTFAGVSLHAFYNPEKEKVRVAVNDWIRSSNVFDGVIDFDAVTRDPQHPSRIRAEYDGGDHLHPNDRGYKAMADAIDLTLLTAP